MSQVFLLPDLGEGLTEAEILDWRVSVGDVVEVDQVVVEVETAKAAVEVPCPHAGRVAALHAEPGAMLPVGQPLITIEPVGGAAEAYREEEHAGSGNVLVGYGTGRARPARRHRLRAPNGNVRVISPIVRRLAVDNGVDLSTLSATGPGGVVRRRDVEAALRAGRTAEPPDGGTRVPLRGMRRAVADKMTVSRREIPDVTVWVDADATGLLETREALVAAYPDRPVGVLALFARIAVAGLRRFPELNSRVDLNAGEIVQSPAVHLGVAAQTDRGLVVPVVPDAQAMTTLELAAALAETTAAARAGSLPPSRLSGSTFTLNNYGVFGVDGSTPIINHPEAALLGIGRIADRPWAVDGQVLVRKVVQVSLTFDHRVCDGDVAGGFLRFVADCVERPAVLVGEL